jgi:hypothetical protein
MIVVSHFIINTPLQRGVRVRWRGPNRFSGFRQGAEAVEKLLHVRLAQNTPLKQGCNEKNPFRMAMFVKHSSYAWRRGLACRCAELSAAKIISCVFRA